MYLKLFSLFVMYSGISLAEIMPKNEKSLQINKETSPEKSAQTSLSQYKDGYDASKTFVQIAVFSKIKRANTMYGKLIDGLPEFEYILKSEREPDGSTNKRYVLRSGPFATVDEAESALVKIEALSPDFKDSIVIDF